MPSVDFTVIGQFEAMAKDLELTTDSSNPCTRRVPMNSMDDCMPLKSDIKEEPDFLYQNHPELDFNNIFNEQYSDSFQKLIPTTVATPPPYPAPSNTEVLVHAPQYPPVTHRTFTGVNASGCTMFSHPDYLSGASVPTGMVESRDLLDLDNQNQQDSFYEELGLTKPRNVLDASALGWEFPFQCMLEQLQEELSRIGVPRDPMEWTTEHVRKWISWICTKNKKADSSSNGNMSFAELCSLNSNDLFRRFGESGPSISMEIELLKSGSSYAKNVPNIANNDNYNRTPVKMPSGRGHKQTIHLWQFLKELLLSKENHSDCIRWLDRKAGIFKIEDSKTVAKLWGNRKNRPAMNYDKLSRSVRQYYKKGIIKKTEQSKRLVYQFCNGYL
ncbi:SAM pointed domain-containing Ets transcription factor-like isoform X2 [Biomphalaria glabrata]|uniref:SAM pointed domain-containing Ets transcription factor-like isoform X2 n=1 Tax=Biomphalaria glabrata TaxID=6526 RepID=A0A9U8ELR6_BIOGL|nr:SAM pointed domain-containing Ets transcription factor-like isoform X2 [Biomphalaria glabrata]